MTAFATPQDMMNRYDVRTLGDICSDNDEPVSQAKLPTNSKLLTALNVATGRIKAAALRAGRYTVDDLEDLTGESAAYLADITCRIAFWNLWKRKPYTDQQQRTEIREEAEEALEEIRNGNECFEVADVIDAGHPSVETVSRVEIVRDWHLAVDQARGHYFPQRRSYKNI